MFVFLLSKYAVLLTQALQKEHDYLKPSIQACSQRHLLVINETGCFHKANFTFMAGWQNCSKEVHVHVQALQGERDDLAKNVQVCTNSLPNLVAHSAA